MLFNSIEFLIFLPIVFILYWKICKSSSSQNIIIVLSSCVFYGWWNWRFLFLITFSIACTFFCGLFLEHYQSNRKIQKLICTINILINLGILFFFKYFNFFNESLIHLLTSIGFKPHIHSLNIILPVGISFYTFQIISYTIDIYRKKVIPTHNFILFFAYISFFPQLVAGPIERATNILPQFQKTRLFNYNQSVDGLKLMLWGFCKKILIADNCALAVNTFFSDYNSFNGFELFIGAILFSFQIYGDFSGYSDIAIGCAQLFGVNLMRNFNYPYFSKNIVEFWKKWHISLNTWFIDYLYIPLGGNRCSRYKYIRNIFIVFLISGLWHGANWTFIFWGLYHAILFILLYFWKIWHSNNSIEQQSDKLSIYNIVCIFTTFMLVTIGWIFFRAESISDAFKYIYIMITDFHITIPHHEKIVLLFIFTLIMVEWIQRKKRHPLQFGTKTIFRYRIFRYTLYYTLIVALLNYSGKQTEFIYFSF